MRSARRDGHPSDRERPVAPAAGRPERGRRELEGLHHWRRRASGASGGKPGSGERDAQAPGGAATRSLFVLTTVDPRACARRRGTRDSSSPWAEGQHRQVHNARSRRPVARSGPRSWARAIDSSQAYRRGTQTSSRLYLAGRGAFSSVRSSSRPTLREGSSRPCWMRWPTRWEKLRGRRWDNRPDVPSGRAHEAARCHRPAPRHGARKHGARGGVGQRESTAPARGLRAGSWRRSCEVEPPGPVGTSAHG